MKAREHDPKQPSTVTALLAAVPAFLSSRGTGASARRFARAAALLAVALAAILALSASASAAPCAGLPPAGSSCLFAGPSRGSEAGQVNNPQAVAVDQSTGKPTSGDVYVGEANNERISVFDSAGHFLRAFGIGVRDGAEELQTCTAATHCTTTAALFTGGFPGLIDPSALAVDPASGAVYASDTSKYRVEKYSFNPLSEEYELDLIFGHEVDKTTHANLCTQANLKAGDTCGAGVLGSGPGQFSNQRMPLALDSSGDVWVGDKNRAEKFGPEGEFLTEVALSGTGEIEALAVDAAGDFYAIKPSFGEQNEIQKITPPASGTYTLTFGGDTTEPISANVEGDTTELGIKIQQALEALPSIGKGNIRYVIASSFQVNFTRALAATDVEQITASAGATVETLSQGSPGTPAVLSKFSPAGVLIETLDEGAPFGHPAALGLDPASGSLFVSDQVNPSENFGTATLLRFAPSGALSEAFGAGEVLGFPQGNVLAFGDGAQRLYIANGNFRFGLSEEVTAAQIFAEPEAGPSLGGAAQATEVKKTAASFCVEVNPEGASTTVHFQYITAAMFKEDGEQFGAGTSETSESASIGSDFTPHQACQPVSALQPATAYRFRVIATNSNAPLGVDGETASFETLPPAAIDSTSVTEVASTSATLQAQINPLGDATSYHFEYLSEAQYLENEAKGEPPFTGAAQAPLQPAPIGSGNADVSVSQHLQGLAPHTPYRFRAVIANAVSEAHGGPFAGPTHSFITQGVGGPTGQSGLPDGRAWELVSPPDKHGANIISDPIQVSRQGDAIAYPTTAPIEAVPQGNYFPRILSARGVGGTSSWSSQDLDLPHPESPGAAVGVGSEYRYFSSDLTHAVVQPFGGFEPSLSPEASEPTAFLRNDFAGAAPPAFCTTSCFRPLVSGCPEAGEPCPPSVEAHADVAPGTVFGKQCDLRVCGPSFRGATPDLSHVVLESGVGLTALPGDTGGLYEFSAAAAPSQALTPISVLPGGQPAAKGLVSFGFEGSMLRNAISAGGSRVFWTASTGKGVQEGHLYLRYNATEEQSQITAGQCTEPAKACTLQLDVVQGGTGFGRSDPVFQLASTDGSRVFFTDTQQLTAGSGANAESPDLYECKVEEQAGKLACAPKLIDLTPASGGEPAAVRGAVLGASADATSLYFVANGVLAANRGADGTHASPGNCRNANPDPTAGCNLYRYHAGVLSFIASLSGADNPSWDGFLMNNLRGLVSRVSSDGRWLAFMSQRPLTGYDSRDALSGKPNEEAFLYDAAAGGGEGKLICASCNPTDARPHGVGISSLSFISPYNSGLWRTEDSLAASLPVWEDLGISEELDYQPRYLSDSGRLFFNSPDALVPQDSNGTWDIYQYEPPGVGSCIESSPTFGKASGGCVDLISSGTSVEESIFLDASESGNDVFFLTAAQLSHRDVDSAIDIYDARVGGGESEPPPPPSCEGDACQSPVSAPNDPTPGSLTFQGPGNFTPALTPPANKKTTKTVKCKKPKKLSHGKCVKSKKKAKKAKRATNNRRAKR